MDETGKQHHDDGPDAEPEIAEYPEAGPYWVGLWAVARHWVGLLVSIFEPDVIASTGITRSFALRCRNWLWPIEGLLRRLIIAAAMKLDVAPPAKIITSKRILPAQKPRQPSVAFTVLPRIPGRQARAAPPRVHAPAPPAHRHLAFPGDVLLNLFPRRDRRNARPVSRRTINPLHRRGRCSRWDPDYQGDLVRDQERNDRYVFGPFPGRLEQPGRDPSRTRAHADGSLPDLPPPAVLPEWKRIEQEWERVIPSANLAGRIRALARVLQEPARWIERTARKLSADLIARIREVPPPKLKKPKLDRTPSGFLEEPLMQAQALFDTS